MKLWFETHSTSLDNERGVASGHLDVPLSERGKAQAAELGVRYIERALAVVYTSDLKRASATGEIAFAGWDLEPLQDPRLRECDYCVWSGYPVAQVDRARADFIEKPFPGGESYQDVVRRIESFLNEVRRGPGPVLVIAHRAPWYAVEHLIHGRDLLEVVTASWTWQPRWEYDL